MVLIPGVVAPTGLVKDMDISRAELHLVLMLLPVVCLLGVVQADKALFITSGIANVSVDAPLATGEQCKVAHSMVSWDCCVAGHAQSAI